MVYRDCSCYNRGTERIMENEMVHLPLRVKPAMKQQIEQLADREGMKKSEYIRFLLRTGLDSRQERFDYFDHPLSQSK